jgi:2,4-dienoyl-CoA reductase-like NADH-dependent reductase (Old Yellow Enzyme family)
VRARLGELGRAHAPVSSVPAPATPFLYGASVLGDAAAAQSGGSGDDGAAASGDKQCAPPIAVGAVGLITTPAQAEQVLADGSADVVLLARQMLREPYFALRAARELGAVVGLPPQYMRAGL